MLNSDLRDFSKRDMKGNWFMAVVMTIVLAIINSILNQIFSRVMPGVPPTQEMLGVNQYPLDMANSFNLGNVFNLGLIGTALGTLFSLGYTWGFLDLVDQAHELENPKLKIEYIFGALNKKFLRNLLAMVLKSIIIFLGFLLLIVPGILLSFMLIPLDYLLKDKPDLPFFDYFKESSRLMFGNKGKYFSLILPYLLAMLAIVFIPLVAIVASIVRETLNPGVFIGASLLYLPILAILGFYFSIKIQILTAEFYGRHLVPRSNYSEYENEVYDYN